MKSFARRIREAVRRQRESEFDRVHYWQVRLRLTKHFQKAISMKIFFFLCELQAPGGSGPTFTGTYDVSAVSHAEAVIAIGIRMASEFPSLKLIKAEFAFSRCESLTEFIKKAKAA